MHGGISDDVMPGDLLNPVYLNHIGQDSSNGHNPYGMFDLNDPREINLWIYAGINPICRRVITQFQEVYEKRFPGTHTPLEIIPNEWAIIDEGILSVTEHIPSGLLDGIHPGNGPEMQEKYRKAEEERLQRELQIKKDKELLELNRKKELCSPSLRLYLNIMDGLGIDYRIVDQPNNIDEEGLSHRHFAEPGEIVVATERACITSLWGTVITDGEDVYANDNWAGKFIDYRSKKTWEGPIELGNQTLPLDFPSLMKELLFGLGVITGEENFSERSEELFQYLSKRYLSLVPGGTKLDMQDELYGKLYRKFVENLIVLCSHNEFYSSNFDFTRNGGLQMILVSAWTWAGLTPEQMRELSLGVQFA
jgi:hypothetical protein